MKAAVLWKEGLAIVRDGRLAVLAGALMLILVGTLIGASLDRQKSVREKADVEEITRQQWDTQGDKHPHRGAHFGIYVFRPDSALSVIDPGVSQHVGQALWLEPHHRNLMRFSPAADAPPSVRFGATAPAFVLAALMPLLVVALTFNSISQEKESGTLRMLYTAGVSVRALVLGKLLAQLGVFGVLLALLFGGLGLLLLGGSPSADELLRGLSMAVAYLMYYLVFSALALAVSAVLRSSRLALLSLIGLWALFVFVVPRVGASLAEAFVPLPSAERFWADIKRDYENGLPGDDDLNAQVRRFEAGLLVQHGVERIEDLPFGVNPVRRMFRDAYNDKVHTHHFDELARRYERQQEILRISSLFSPSIAMRLFSMKMAGTDLAHLQHFENAAEHYRRYFNTEIDRWDAENTRGVTSYEEDYGDDALWQSIDGFRYQSPHVGFAWKAAMPDFLLLIGWMGFAGLVLSAATRRLMP